MADQDLLALERVRELTGRFNDACPWRSIVAVSRFLPSAFVPNGQMYVLDLAQAEIGEGGYRVVGSQTAIDFICSMQEWQGMSRNEIAACIVWNQLRLWERETGRTHRPLVSEDDLQRGILNRAMRMLNTDIS
jgi:hypothetical protein